MAKHRINKTQIPKTQLDVDRAYNAGMNFGIEFCLNLILFVLKDKHNAPNEDIMQLRDEFMYQVDSIGKRYMSYRDVVHALKSEYDLSVHLSERKA